MAMAFGKIYTFGPTFRAEKSNTARHAAEFWMIEPEIAFADLNDDMDLARDMIKFVLAYVLEQCPDEMRFFNQFYDKTLIERLTALIDSDFTHVTYTEAIEILEQHKDQFDYPVYWGCDLQTEHERFLEGIFVLVILLSLTTIVSYLNERIRNLVQTIAILEKRVRELEQKENQDETE